MTISVESVRLSVARRLTLNAAAKVAGVHHATVWRWALRGVKGRKLATKLVGGRRYVLLADLETFLNRDATAAAQPAKPQNVAPAVEAGAMLDQLLSERNERGK